METVAGDDHFLQTSVLDILIPSDSTVDVREYLNNRLKVEEQREAKSIVTSLAERSFLFFDEVVHTYVVFKTNFRKEDQLRELLGRLTVIADVYAVDTATPPSPGNEEPTQHKQLVSRKTLSISQEPVIVLPESEVGHEEVNNQAAYTLWSLQFALPKPKIELQSPCFQITAKALLKPREDASNTEKDEYLPSGVPTAINLLRPTRDGASVIERPQSVLTTTTSVPRRRFRKSVELVKQATAKDFRGVSALDARIGLCRLNDHPTNGTLIAALRIKMASSAGCDVAIETVVVSHSSGQVKPVVRHPKLEVPMLCKPGDEMSLVYKVIPTGLPYGQFRGISKADRLTVNIKATALVNEVCRPQIRINLETDADPMSDLKRESSKRSPQAQDEAGLLGPLTTKVNVDLGPQVDVLPTYKENLAPAGFSSQDGTNNRHNFGIFITFIGPDDVYVGQNFTWELFVVNRSAQERIFAIMPIVRRATFDYKTRLMDLAAIGAAGHRYTELAEAVRNDKSLHSIDRDEILKPGELMSVSPDVQAGPLAPAGCYSTKLQFLPLLPGVLHLDAIRIVELASGAFVDLRDLPDIVALKRVQV